MIIESFDMNFYSKTFRKIINSKILMIHNLFCLQTGVGRTTIRIENQTPHYGLSVNFDERIFQ